MTPPGVVGFSNFASGTTDFGFETVSHLLDPNTAIESVAFDNGDTYTGPLQLTETITFYHFNDTDPFTAAVVSFIGGNTFILNFRTAAPISSVPEPSSLALLAAGAVLAGVSTWHRRKTS